MRKAMRTGLVAEFHEEKSLLGAIAHLCELGYTDIDAYTPYPMDEVIERLPAPRSKIPLFVLVGGLCGAGFGYVVQWFCNAYDFPINVGGRPVHSAPALIPITFESAVLFASLTGFFALLAIARLPRIWDQVFEVGGFNRASTNRFFVAVSERDPIFDWSLADELRTLGARRITAIRGRS